MSFELLYAFVPVSALLLDSLLGDPRTRWHPVVLIGDVITFFEAKLYDIQQRSKAQLLRGIILVFSVLLTVFIVVSFFLLLAIKLNYYAYLIVSVLVLYISITPRSLARDGFEICKLLRQKDLKSARSKLSWIVGRDTDNLDEQEISRATIETIAENIVDGIISPLFYFFLFGPLGAIIYRAANTLDSMVGYKNDRYLYFGRAAARFDDILNYIPARLVFILIIIAAFFLRYNALNAWNITCRDAKKHPSPNGGYPEAACAGALNIRLGGYNSYNKITSLRAYMGEAQEIINEIHIIKTIKLMYFCSILFVSIITILLIVKEIK